MVSLATHDASESSSIIINYLLSWQSARPFNIIQTIFLVKMKNGDISIYQGKTLSARIHVNKMICQLHSASMIISWILKYLFWNKIGWQQMILSASFSIIHSPDIFPKASCIHSKSEFLGSSGAAKKLNFPQICPKMPQNCPKMAKNDPKWPKYDPKITLFLC